MLKYALGIIVGALMVVYGYVRIYKNREALAELPLQKYEKMEFSSSIIPWLIGLAAFSVFCLYVSLKENNDALTAVSIAILVDCVVEYVVARKLMVFYYNNDRCILEGKQVLYRNIKSCGRRSRLPLSKGLVSLYSGEVKKVYPQAIPVINAHLNQ
ncbi:MAG: hypothetical protein IJM79_08280 [Erysipelotrichaceae bacterium]|nr:hypothetical protein [Erysipelotrichaceae bacterium]